MSEPLFGSMFLAGFECSTQRRWDRARLDLIEATRHDAFCESDYALVRSHGFAGARDGFRWHLIEQTPGVHDWSSIRPMLQAARRQKMRVIWDLCHYGYPDWLDIWSDSFLEAFARYCGQAVRLIREESGEAPMICPVNEISFWAWLGGKEAKINPYTLDRPHDLKRQLVRAKLAGIAAARAADPETLVISAEPLINMVRDTNDEADIQAAADYHQSQFEAVDLMLGRLEPELGGHERAIDVIGVNFYPHNQWRIRGGFVPMGHHDYRPLSELLAEVYERYRRPLFIAETGAEHSARPVWMHYVCQEVRAALEAGVPVGGICIYPITEYQGWDNGRICQVGLFCCANDRGERAAYTPLLDELRRQQTLFDAMRGPRQVFRRAG
jgi:beta-glucosidase/6-phospho-beta-glucosidase/beta-galactosidase